MYFPKSRAGDLNLCLWIARLFDHNHPRIGGTATTVAPVTTELTTTISRSSNGRPFRLRGEGLSRNRGQQQRHLLLSPERRERRAGTCLDRLNFFNTIGSGNF
jgi:hypothetical protein